MKKEPLIDAVLFDFGGVVTTSPFEAFSRYENEIGAPLDSIRRINSTNPDNNAWAKMERSEVTVSEFCKLFEAEATDLGLKMSGQKVLECLSGNVRPQIMQMFEVVVESAKVGIRKPDVRIYELACSELGVDPRNCAYLDDLGINCKPAANLGMVAIKVVDPEVALDHLESVVGFSLR